MDLSPALDWQPPDHWQRLIVIESHAGGEPFRVVIEGLPSIPGGDRHGKTPLRPGAPSTG